MTDAGGLWVAAMRAGRFDDAWRLSDAALALRLSGVRDDPALPYHLRWVWDGRPLDGEDVLVRCYHGLGDTIQFARFLPLLAERAASVTLEVQPRLMPILGGLDGVDRMLPFDPERPAPQASHEIEITELAHALRADPSSAPSPYLLPAPRVQPAPTIGLCYGAGEWDPDRSIPPALFAGIAARHRTVSLVAEPTDLRVVDPAGCPFDMDATAALVAGLDLVVTVDTMIAHLAGALGRPTWLLLKHDPDWRWDPARTDTPWYPTMRLFAQEREGDWAPVVARVGRELASLDMGGGSGQRGGR